ncbi:hypothetical protein B0H16DRAFT_1494443 [Mycena metata]|uniref:Uncharacterized protein n=1 Tax=Mycena metata TaxID=1033252 RepID=A0AAD7KCZ4_9AGAR|nr:hypothetical protein B0H16DRAFT_1494443 [Mycena metata]
MRRPLRILYSINGSPQYILARSSCPSGASSSRSVTPAAPRFASASFKTCLNTICCSSPELIQDRNRDYSVYLLDPLETEYPPAQMNILPQAPTQEPPPEARVAVGLGFMSWELKSHETEVKWVTGTLKVSGTGQEVLEIIFSLRETIAMEKASLPDTLRSWSEPRPSINHRREKKPGPYPSRKPKPNVPVTQSDILLGAPIYIGPERVSGPGGIRKHPPPSFDLLAFLRSISPEAAERNKALGNILGLVHGSEGNSSNLRPSQYPQLFQPPPSQPTPQYPHSHPIHHPLVPPQLAATAASSHSQHRRRSSSTDDEIVILNKENVNPTVFRRRAERDAKPLPAVGPSTTPASSSGPPPASSSLPFPASSPAGPPPAASLSATLPPAAFQTQEPPTSSLGLLNQSSSQPLRRKRTLSEFMEEQEAARERERALKKDYYRQPERSMSEGDFTFLIATKATTKPKPNRRSKVRRRTASTASSPGPEKFILPEWARTDTATQPRLADDIVQKIEQERKERKEEERKKREAKRRELKTERVERGEFGRRKRQGAAAAAPARTSSLATANGVLLPAPVAASGEFPTFPTSRSPFVALPGGSPSRSAAQNNAPPCTPPRKRRANTISTPGGASSLFTPGSALFTPGSARGTLDLGRHSVSPSRRARTEEPERPTESSGDLESDDDLLDQQLNSAFDELDFPPSSLPVASSDKDVDEGLPNSSPEYDSDESDDDDAPPPKQHLGAATPDVRRRAHLRVNSPDTEVTNYSLEELGKLLDIDDLANFFPPAGTDNDNALDAATLFDQFTDNTHLDLASSDSAQTMQDWGLSEPNPDFDFTEFWESVRPLVEGSALPDTNTVAGESGP